MTVDEMIDDILRREGGYVNHPNDRGGETNYGITKATLEAYDSSLDIKTLTRDKAAEIYKSEYYFRPNIDKLPKAYQPIVFDMAVNHGPKNAIKIFQKVIRSYAASVSVDGIIGRLTIMAAEGALYDGLLKSEITKERIAFYADIVANDNSQAVFLKGWLKRAREFV